MRKYTVREGDNLWKIARQHGFQSEQDLLSVQENKDFFESSERNAFRLYPGDTIHIPDLRTEGHAVKLNTKQVFRTPSKKGIIRLKVNDVEGEPLSKFKYEAEFLGEKFTGDESTANGVIEIEIPQKKKNNIVQMPLEGSDEASDSNINDQQHTNIIDLKLFVNPNEPDAYDAYRVHTNFDSNDERTGQLQLLSNEGIYHGYIPNTAYEDNLGQVNQQCFPEETWSRTQLESMKNDGANLTPIPSPRNFEPQYYIYAWEILRYARLFNLADQRSDMLERRISQLKSEGSPYDVSEINLSRANIDKAYYQYCFNYWMSEFSSLWNANLELTSTAESLIRNRSHVEVDQVLKDLNEKWQAEFDTKTDSDEIKAMPFPESDLPHHSSARDLYATYYSVQQAKDDLATTIVSPPLTSKARFSYQDSPDTPIANSYILYWRYDKADTDRIETGREEYYRNARIMMPIGMGRTDENGYLIQSLPFDRNYDHTHIKIEDEMLAINSGAAVLDGVSLDFTQPFMARYKNNAAAQRFINTIRPPRNEWNDLFNSVNSYVAMTASDEQNLELDEETHGLYGDRDRFNTHNELTRELIELNAMDPVRYKNMRLSVSNHKFNYYSSGSQVGSPGTELEFAL